MSNFSLSLFTGFISIFVLLMFGTVLYRERRLLSERLILAIGRASKFPQAIARLDGDRLVIIWHNEALSEFASEFGELTEEEIKHGSLIGKDWYKIFDVKPRWKKEHREVIFSSKELSNDCDYWEKKDAYLSWRIVGIASTISLGILFEFQNITQQIKREKELIMINKKLTDHGLKL